MLVPGDVFELKDHHNVYLRSKKECFVANMSHVSFLIGAYIVTEIRYDSEMLSKFRYYDYYGAHVFCQKMDESQVKLDFYEDVYWYHNIPKICHIAINRFIIPKFNIYTFGNQDDVVVFHDNKYFGQDDDNIVMTGHIVSDKSSLLLWALEFDSEQNEWSLSRQDVNRDGDEKVCSIYDQDFSGYHRVISNSKHQPTHDEIIEALNVNLSMWQFVDYPE